MAVRHRIPTIFNIYMVDVLCCALGCVILLWQVSYQDAEARNEKLKNERLSNQSLANEMAKLDAAKSALAAKYKLTDDELADRIRENAKLLLDIAASQKRVDTLAKDLDEKASALTLLDKNLGEHKSKLAEAERLHNLLGKEKLELLAKMKTSDLRVRVLEGDLERLTGESSDAQRKIADLVKDKEAANLRMMISTKDLDLLRAALAKQNVEALESIRRAKASQAAAENRFAGITLTGKKVVFMVDMSGSMELTDFDTADPDKWPFVCETIARILASLTEVTHYQVFLFSDKVTYPLLNEGRWFEVRDKLQDAKTVAERVKQIKPKGPTNMYAAFDEAFKYRALGLDTIYVISDGLPNDGPGLPANASKLSEQEITTILSKHLRAKLKNDWNRTIADSPKVRINTIGFFYESPDVGAFLWALAREHDGSFVGMNKSEK